MLYDTHLPPEVRGRLVPGLPLWKAASIAPVPGRVDVPGLAKPVRGRPVLVIGLTAGLAPCNQGHACMQALLKQESVRSLVCCRHTLFPVSGRAKDVPGLADCATAFSSNSSSAMPCRKAFVSCSQGCWNCCCRLTCSSVSVSSSHSCEVSARHFKYHTACNIDSQVEAQRWGQGQQKASDHNT